MDAPLSGCGSYLLISLRVRPDKPFPRVVRILEGLGARLNYMDEEQRRITGLVSASRLPSIVELEGEYTDYVSVIVKASCRGEPEALGRRLRELGFTKTSRGSLWVFLGSYKGRAVEVEVRGRRVKLKVGGRVTGKPRPPLPPGLFTLQPGEASDAVRVLKDLIAMLRE